MKRVPSLVMSGLLQLGLAVSLPAQVPGTPDAGIFSANLRKLFGAHIAFAAATDVHIFNRAGEETTAMTMNFSVLPVGARIETDTAAIRTKDVSAEAIAQFKSLGMDKMVTVVRPDKRTTYVIYPGLKAYAELPMSAEEAAARDTEIKMEKTILGKETVDQHPAQKTKVVLSSKNQTPKEALVWFASDLKDFPVKIQMTEGPNTMVMSFRNLKLAAPDAKMFEIPAGYARHASIEQLVQGELMKRLGTGGGTSK